MGSRPAWSALEIALLVQMRTAGDNRRAIVLAIGRTGPAISAKARRLTDRDERLRPLNLTRCSNRNAPWTAADISTLRDMVASGAAYPTIARDLKRTKTDAASMVHGTGSVATARREMV